MKYGRAVTLAVSILMALALVGCGDDKVAPVEANQLPKITRVNLGPINSMVGETLRSVVESEDQELDPVELEFEWYVDGKKVSQTGVNFDTTDLEPQSQVHFRVRAKEVNSGRTTEWTQSNSVELVATPPPKLAGIDLQPEQVTIFTELNATVDYGDVDPYSLEEVHYRWLVNGSPLDPEEFNGPNLSAGNFKRGDKIQIKACTDGKFTSPNLVLSPIRFVVNLPPEFEGEPQMVQSGGIVNVYLTATDPEKDRLKYFLTNPPPLTTIDPNTGVITIKYEKLPAGAYKLTYGVDDQHGGRSTYQTSFSKEK